MKNNNYDSIVIGSGLGGLTTAALLTHHGQKVLVLEKRDVPGGYASNFKRKNFTFDCSLHQLTGASPGTLIWEILDKCWIVDKVEFIRHREFMRGVFPDLDIIISQCSLETHKRQLIQLFPHEEENIHNVFAALIKICDEMVRFLRSKIPLWIEMIYFPLKYPHMAFNSKKTLADILAKIKDQRLKDIIGMSWGYYGLPPSQLSAEYFAAGWAAYLRAGGYCVRGGSQALSNAFVASIKEGGSEVKLNSPVKKILIEDGKAMGVETINGERFFARNIISNVNIPATVFQMVGEEYFPRRYISKIKSQIPAISAAVVYLGLDTTFQELGVNDYEISLHPNYDFDAQYTASVEGDFKNAHILLALHSNIDESTAPEGKGVMSITALSGYEIWANLSEEEYKRKKDETTKIFIDRSEKVIPNLSKHIEVCEIATPLTMERRVGSYKGAFYGYAQFVRQSGFLRVPEKTPIKNLDFVGAWTVPGGGYSSVMLSAYELFKILT